MENDQTKPPLQRSNTPEGEGPRSGPNNTATAPSARALPSQDSDTPRPADGVAVSFLLAFNPLSPDGVLDLQVRGHRPGLVMLNGHRFVPEAAQRDSREQDGGPEGLQDEIASILVRVSRLAETPHQTAGKILGLVRQAGAMPALVDAAGDAARELRAYADQFKSDAAKYDEAAASGYSLQNQAINARAADSYREKAERTTRLVKALDKALAERPCTVDPEKLEAIAACQAIVDRAKAFCESDPNSGPENYGARAAWAQASTIARTGLPGAQKPPQNGEGQANG